MKDAPLALRVGGVRAGAATRGEVTVTVRAGERLRRVTLYVDGRAVSRDGRPPYRLAWETRQAAEGPHELFVYARTPGGRRAAEAIPVIVANADLPSSLERAWGTVDDAIGVVAP